MKGRLKRLQSRFKKGHSKYKGCDEYLPPSEQTEEPYNLRSSKDEPTTDEYFISHVGCQESMWNESFRAHLNQSLNCEGNLKMKKTRHAVLSTDWLLHCDTCTFKSTSYMMYKTVPARHCGQKHSSLNLAFGAGMIKSPIGPQVCREMLLTAGIDPGSKSGLQKVMNAAGEIIVGLGQDHLLEEQKKVQILCKEEGVKSIMAEDLRYNNHQSASPAPGTFQAGTQAVATFCSFNTDKVVDVFVANKHCAKAFALRGKGIVVNCPDHDGKCSANMKMEDPIGNEGHYTRQIAQRFKQNGTPCDDLLVDGDSKGGNEFSDEMGGNVEVLKDTVHLARGQKRRLSKYIYSKEMFVGESADQKSHAKSRFCEDVRLRCTAEFNAVIKLSQDLDSDGEKKAFVTNKLANTPHGIVECYKGNHALCQKLTFACKPQENKPWPKSCLPHVMKDKMKMTSKDEILFRKGIRLRLGATAISKTFKNLTTNKVEAMNKAYSKTNPKSILSTTNLRPRILAAVLTNNLGFDVSCFLIQNSIHHKVCAAVSNKIMAHAEVIRKKKALKRTTRTKMKRIKRKSELYALHNKMKAKKGLKQYAPSEVGSECSNLETVHYQSGLTLFEDIDGSEDEIEIKNNTNSSLTCDNQAISTRPSRDIHKAGASWMGD